MRPVFRPAAALAALSMAACSPATSSARSGTTTPSPAEQVRADSGLMAWTDADVRFMQGMILHHAQAIQIAGWADGHGASQTVRVLAGRIVVSQQDEINIMATWLRDRRQSVPDTGSAHLAMPGMDHGAQAPGMLSATQLAQLDAARGTEFDRLFMTFMIQHHRGALVMVQTLLGSTGAAQQPRVFKIASDMHADQEAEIDRMTQMLQQQSGGRTP